MNIQSSESSSSPSPARKLESILLAEATGSLHTRTGQNNFITQLFSTFQMLSQILIVKSHFDEGCGQ